MKISNHGLLLSLFPALLGACAETPAAQPELGEELSDFGGQRGVRLMTQNMYVGLDVLPLAFAPFDQLPFAVADGFDDDGYRLVGAERLIYIEPISWPPG